MSVDITEQDILNVFLESDTDEDDCLIEENGTEQEKHITRSLNNHDLDHDHSYTIVTVDVDPWDYLDHANMYSNESLTEEGLKCGNAPSKNFVDLSIISPAANSEETARGYMVTW